MPSNYTTNYKLNQWVKTDKVLMEDFNADNKKIDDAIKAVDTKADGLAKSKADVSALESEVSARTAAMASANAALDGKGNCQIYTTSYPGGGSFGPTSPSSLTFPKKPAVVFIGDRAGGATVFAIQGQAKTYTNHTTTALLTLTWSGNTMTWYASTDASGQLNKSGSQYDVVALISL